MDHDDLLTLPDGKTLGRSGDYLVIGDTRFYFESHGRGPPLMLMHGAWATMESLMFQVGPLSERFRVILVERRGHGRTHDTPGRFTYRQGVKDMFDCLDALGHDRVDLMGWSDGAVLGLLMAKERPERVRRLVSISGSYHHRGYTRDFARWFEEASPDRIEPMITRVYGWTSPDGPDHFPVVFEKIRDMSSSHPRFSRRDLASIQIPTLVMAGDQDIVSLDHTINLYRGLPHGYLSVLPGSSHMLPMERPDLVNLMVIQFLEAENLDRSDGGLFRS